MKIQSGINRVISLAGMLGSIRAKNAPEAEEKPSPAPKPEEKLDHRITPMDEPKRIPAGKNAYKKLQAHVAETMSQESLEDAQTQKRKRRNFLQYMYNQPTDFGKFGDLPLEGQKWIAKTYSPYQRKKIMDAEDARRGEK